MAAALAFVSFASMAFAQVPSGYPDSYRDVIAAANREGKLVVYSVTSSVPALLEG